MSHSREAGPRTARYEMPEMCLGGTLQLRLTIYPMQKHEEAIRGRISNPVLGNGSKFPVFLKESKMEL